MRRLLNALCYLAAVTLLAAPLGAADYSWNATNGFVSDSGNWSPAGLPGTGTGDNVAVQNSGIAKIDADHLFGANVLGNLTIGDGSSASSVVQSGGSVAVDGGFVVANGVSSYGYYSISDGSLTINSGGTANMIGNYGSAVFSQTGGNVNLAGNGYMILGWHGGATAPSVMNITGGNYSQHTAGNWTYGILVGWGTSSGVLNIGGSANVNLAADYTSGNSGYGSVLIGNGDSGFAGSGIMNLGSVGTGGGTLTAGIVRGWYNRQSATVNFHGGTLVSSVYAGELSNLDHAYVYSEGAIFDIPEGNDFNIYSNLETPAIGMGQGLSEITLIDNGSGFIGEPVVTITPAEGDTGVGATARAILNSAGGIDHIEITNPGVGYTMTPMVTLSGGGGTAPSEFAVTLVDNVSGGLTKKGTGVLYMNADCTYTGVTTVEQGTLYINKIATASSGVVVKDTSTLAGESLPGMITGYILPATTVETGGTIAPGAVGRTLFIDTLLFADGAKLDFQTAAGGASDKLEIMSGGVSPAGTSTPVVVTVDYHGTVDTDTPLLFTYGYLSRDVLFQLPAGLPKLDSEDGRHTPVTLDTVYEYGGSVTLKPGGDIADPKWNVFAGGAYNTAGNWDPNAVPNGGGQRAMFTGSLGPGAINVSLDISPQLSSMVFDSPTGESYNITPTGTNSITLDSTIAQNWHISVLAGTHAVGANLSLQAGSGESEIRLADNSKLTLSGVLRDETTAANVNVVGNFNGGTLGNGVLVLSGANTYTGKTTVTNAVLEISSLDVVANANPLGKSSAVPENLVLTNSTMRYTGTVAATTDRGLTVAGANVKLDTNSQVGFAGKIVAIDTPTITKTGTGTWTFNNPTNDVNNFGGPMIVAQGTVNFSGGTDSTYKVGYLHVGDPTGGASTVNQSNGTVNTGTYSGGYLMIGRPGASGVYNLTGGKLVTERLYTGFDGSGVLKIGGTSAITSLGFSFGNAAPGAGYQSGGTVTLQGGGPGSGVSGDWGEMFGVSASGYYGISGGTLKLANENYTEICFGYSESGPGIFEQTGGTVTASNSSIFRVGMSGVGVGSATLNLLGGTFTSNNDNWGRGIVLYNGNGVLNIAGTAQVDMQGTGTTAGYILAGGTNPQIVNVGGTSVVKAGFIKGWDSPTNAVINFHGGTIVARESTDASDGSNSDPASFMNDWTHAYIYSEGVKFRVDEGHASTISQVFEDPTGKGVTQASVSVTDGGSSYISPPLVAITGGGGSGATAYATLDSTGHVNGIVISNPGVNYSSVPTFTLSGGGGSGAVVAIDDTLFVQNVGGTLEKLGPGELTLTGASTYSGDTVVNDGILNVTLGIHTPNATVYVATGGTLNAPSIVADTLEIGGASRTSASALAVPEPGMFALLALALLGLSAWLRVERK